MAFVICYCRTWLNPPSSCGTLFCHLQLPPHSCSCLPSMALPPHQVKSKKGASTFIRPFTIQKECKFTQPFISPRISQSTTVLCSLRHRQLLLANPFLSEVFSTFWTGSVMVQKSGPGFLLAIFWTLLVDFHWQHPDQPTGENVCWATCILNITVQDVKDEMDCTGSEGSLLQNTIPTRLRRWTLLTLTVCKLRPGSFVLLSFFVFSHYNVRTYCTIQFKCTPPE